MAFSRSVLVKKFGGYECLSVENYQLPFLKDNVEVEVKYAGLNFADLYTRKGLIKRKLPFVLGMECAGTITAIECEDTELKVGQKVICYDHNGGMYREKVRVPKDKCFPLPDDISCEEGAAMFVNYLTAYLAVIEIGNLKPQETVLILSCSGGVGTAAVQIAKTIEGVTVFGTGSDYKEAQAKENGVDVFICNEAIDVHLMQPEKFDLILSNQSGPVFTYLQTLLKPLGKIVQLGVNNLIQDENQFSLWTLLNFWWNTKDISLSDLIMSNRMIAGLHLGILVEKDRKRILNILEHIYALFRNKKIKPIIHSIHPMSEIVSATKILAERQNIGKVMLSIQ